MKSPKSRVAETHRVPPSDVKPAKPQKNGLPTTGELAILAATIRQYPDDSPESLMERAMSFWMEARHTILMADFADEIGRQDKEFETWKDVAYRYFQPSDKYPITRDEFLRKMLPQSANRPHLWVPIAKEYLREKLLKNNRKEPTQDGINAAYAKWPPIPSHYSAVAKALDFEKWHSDYIRKSRRNAGRKSAANRKSLKNSDQSSGNTKTK
jgi:hypothetical protein